MYSDGVRGLGGIRVASHPRFSHSLRQRQAAASVVKGTTRQVQEWEKKSLTRYVTLFSVGQERPRFKSTAGPALSITAQTPRKPTAASCRWAVRVWVDRGGGRSPRCHLPDSCSLQLWIVSPRATQRVSSPRVSRARARTPPMIAKENTEIFQGAMMYSVAQDLSPAPIL
jgi:hypothetical protein